MILSSLVRAVTVKVHAALSLSLFGGEPRSRWKESHSPHLYLCPNLFASAKCAKQRIHNPILLVDTSEAIHSFQSIEIIIMKLFSASAILLASSLAGTSHAFAPSAASSTTTVHHKRTPHQRTSSTATSSSSIFSSSSPFAENAITIASSISSLK